MLTRSLFTQNSVAKRLLWAFVLAAVIPVSLLGILSFHQVTEELEQSAFSDLRQSSKEYALGLIARIQLAETALRVLQSKVSALHNEGQIIDPYSTDNTSELFSHIVHYSNDMEWFVKGQPTLLPSLNAQDKAVLNSDEVVITTTDQKNGTVSIWVIVPLSASQDGYLMGRFFHDSIWERELLGVNELMVYGKNGELWFTTLDDTQLSDQVEQHILEQVSGSFRWSTAETHREAYFGSFWHAPLRNMFHSPEPVIVLLKPEKVALSASRYFKSIYPPIVGLVILIILYLITKLITRYLSPLTELQVATEKLSQGDFSYEVEVASRDEFYSLANSFNKMTDQLRKQFEVQATMAEIDRQILSARDANEVIEAALDRLLPILNASMMAIATLEPKSPKLEKLHYRISSKPIETVDNPSVLSDEDLEKLKALGGHYVTLSAEELPPYSYIRKVMKSKPYYYLVIPVVVEQTLSAIVGFAYRDMTSINEEVKKVARNFGDRIAVALSNAAWEDKLYKQAHYDSLTGLPNRRVLHEGLGQVIARARRDNSIFALFFIDLDRFKNINDSLGHAMGDNLLIEVAKRLVDSSRTTDLVVRISGDEFVIVLTDTGDQHHALQDLAAVAEKLLAALSEPFFINDQILHITASIGIAVYPDDAETPESMLENADAAMYHAKASGRGTFNFYQAEMTLLAIENMELERALRNAIKNHELRLYLQPKYDVNQDVVGAEALIRWEHSELGLISPAKFIPIAEQTLLVIDIGCWVFEQCCLLINHLVETGLPVVPIAVNLSAIEFNREDLITNLSQILDRTQTDPHYLELELTETVAITDKETCIRRMKDIRELGLDLTMDDFGTGFSSLSYLQDFPLNTLKIDQQFVRNIEQGRKSQAIIKSIIALAQGLEMQVIAEGVETPEQLDFLLNNGCRLFQGFWFSRPIPEKDFLELLKQETLDLSSFV
ncbi:EAL domain-containing protein [Methylophaga sp. OBS1]|uniref:EAL domain-containing protein n=1 Tax=Methylophaga sp. OBS1 TaxID=2991933 RepID=UPI002254A4F8|nr:EAL domain-containing protein [Methylophaga sp. OBS1]MCX4191375.1 EAL domain-containing protein [Methylophaga sp. OBS1]MCX4191679.1 EAL domain-containing protein [Methylophaga sp. OBS1]